MNRIPGDSAPEELLEGIIALGQALGMSVIVEGVETEGQERELCASVADGPGLSPSDARARRENRGAVGGGGTS